MLRAASSTLQAITANRLDDGLVVFQTATGGWSLEVHAAEVLDGAEAVDAALARAAQAEKDRIVVGAYAIDVAETGRGPEPTRLRERIRAFGPTAGSDTPPASKPAAVRAA